MARVRKMVKRTSMLRRHSALCAKESLKIEILKRQVVLIMIVWDIIDDSNEHDEDIFLGLIVLVFILLQKYYQLKYEPESIINANKRKYLKFKDFTSSECWVKFRFRKCDLSRLLIALKIPKTLSLCNKSTVTGEEALLVTLFRLSSLRTYEDIADIFGGNGDTWCRTVNVVISYLYDTHNHLLHNNLGYFKNKLPSYNSAICRELNRRGYEIPLRISKTAYFVDGKKVRTCKIKGPNIYQESIYTKHGMMHCFKIQSCIAPDGIYMDLSKPFRGSMHDSEILTRSQLNLRLADIQNNEIVQYTFYADKGYPISIGHGRGSFRNTQNMLPFQRLENTISIL